MTGAPCRCQLFFHENLRRIAAPETGQHPCVKSGRHLYRKKAPGSDFRFGVLKTTGYVDLSTLNLEQFADKIIDKIKVGRAALVTTMHYSSASKRRLPFASLAWRNTFFGGRQNPLPTRRLTGTSIFPSLKAKFKSASVLPI
jgi:hypothetical protein